MEVNFNLCVCGCAMESKIIQDFVSYVAQFYWTHFLFLGCGEGYRLDNYPQFQAVNSQAAEQANSSIGKLKSMLSYMNHENFMLHCSFYLWFLNWCRLHKWFEGGYQKLQEH